MRGSDEITNSQDIIDSRDIIERIEYLQDERSALESAIETAQEERNEYNPPEEEWNESTYDGLIVSVKNAKQALTDWAESDEGRELKALLALQDEAEGYSEDWRDGATLIRDTYFEDYAREFAQDIGAIKESMDWPCNCIDWEKAADELKQDYTSVDFDGVEYWVR
jgi:hypothetical protein